MWHNLVNTRYFSEAAIGFRNNGGHYTLAPRGSKDYFEYWKLHEKRCQEGYKVGDIWIPGRYYFYLNFFPMYKVRDSDALKAFQDNKQGRASKRVLDKILDFPRFHEMQYEWWRFKHIAWHGGTFMGIVSPGGKHLCCAKTRGAGFSYMEAADGVYNYNFIDGSKSYYFASREAYLIEDGILNKVDEGLTFLNKHSAYWRKNRMKNKTLMHQKASFIDSRGEEKGTMSEIMGQTVDNPNKVRGKRGKKITFEEFGSFKRGKTALEVSLGSLRDGDFYVGQLSAFGTGGEEGEEIEALESVFTEPHSWDMLAFPNIWEAGASSEVGYFVPCYRANFKYTDEDGNSDMDASIVSDDEERAKKQLSADPRALDRRKAEYPQKPSELFQRLSNNGFNIAEIKQQIKFIETNTAIKHGLLRHGNLVSSEAPEALGGILFEIDPNAKPLDEYPHKQNKDAKEFIDLKGCVTICEKPYIDLHGKVPSGMYAIVFDAYYKDDADDLTSLFDVTVLKIDNPVDNSMVGLPVAWWTGRPKSLKRAHEILFNMARYYNCTVQGEISGGGQSVVDYAKQHRILHMVEFEPEMLHNKEVASNQKNRSYLMNMSTDRKKLGMTYLEDWHMEPRGITANGNPVYNVHKIYKLGLLREMLKGGIANSDRMSSMIIGMFVLKENITKLIQHKTSLNTFYDRPLYTNSESVTEFSTAY